MAALAGSFSGDEISLLTRILQKPETLSNGRQAMDDYIDIIKQERQKQLAQGDLRLFAEQIRNRKGYGG